MFILPEYDWEESTEVDLEEIYDDVKWLVVNG
jgi:hypothetical protein